MHTRRLKRLLLIPALLAVLGSGCGCLRNARSEGFDPYDKSRGYELPDATAPLPDQDDTRKEIAEERSRLQTDFLRANPGWVPQARR